MKFEPKLILTDIDGVWTDGGMYYAETGEELKKFNTSDSAGVLFCHKAGIKVGIITGEKTALLIRRAKKLKITIIKQGVKNKLKVAIEVCKKLNIDLKDVAYIGDDIGDYSLLKSVGFSGAPNNAASYIKDVCDFNGNRNGGEGAFREFVEFILKDKLRQLIEELVDDQNN